MAVPWKTVRSHQRMPLSHEINTRLNGVAVFAPPSLPYTHGARQPHIVLRTHSGLIATMSEPDLDLILGWYGVLITEGAGADVDQAVDTLARWRRGLSVRYLLPASSVDYTDQHGLYMDKGQTPSAAAGAIQAEREKGKEKEMGGSSSVAGGC